MPLVCILMSCALVCVSRAVGVLNVGRRLIRLWSKETCVLCCRSRRRPVGRGVPTVLLAMCFWWASSLPVSTHSTHACRLLTLFCKGLGLWFKGQVYTGPIH